MGRPGLFGRQLCLDRNGKFVGCNLGYNFYCEHEDSEDRLAQEMNFHFMNSVKTTMSMSKVFCKDRRQMKRLKDKYKEVQKSAKLMENWRCTPFKDKIVHPLIPCFKREIKINNSSIRGKYSKYLTCDGDYTIVGINCDESIIKGLNDGKTTFCEEDLIYMRDYAGGTAYYNYGYSMALARGEIGECGVEPICGSWSAGGNSPIVILINRDLGSRTVGAEIITALKAGNLACTYAEPRLFKDRGCCFIDLDAAYKSEVR